MVRILHCADLHLEASFARLGLPPAVGNMLREELRTTLGSILSEARRLQVDAVTFAGDLYEGATAGLDTARFLVQQFERMGSIKILIAPGERDACSSHSLYELTSWPPNVHIFASSRFESFALAADVTVWGAACPASDPQVWQQVTCSPSSLHVLLAHAAEAQTTAPVFAVSENALRSTGIRLALLGGNHQAKIPEITPTPDGGAAIVFPSIVFPGSPQPLDWDAGTGGRGAALVTIDQGRCQVQQVQFGAWRLTRIGVDAGGCLSAEDAGQRIAKALADDLTNDLACEGAKVRTPRVAQVSLEGEPAGDFTLADVHATLATLLAALPASALADSNVILRRPFALAHDLDQLAVEQTVRGTLVRGVQAQLAATTDTSARADLLAALKAALLALEGRQVHLDAIA